MGVFNLFQGILRGGIKILQSAAQWKLSGYKLLCMITIVTLMDYNFKSFIELTPDLN